MLSFGQKSSFLGQPSLNSETQLTLIYILFILFGLKFHNCNHGITGGLWKEKSEIPMKKVVIESNDTSEPMEITDEFYLDEIPSDLHIHIVGQEASSFPIDDDFDDMDDFDFDLDEASEPPVQTHTDKGSIPCL